MEPVKAIRMMRAIAGLCLTAGLALAWLVASALFPRLAPKVLALGWKTLLAAFGIKIITRGTPQPGAFYIANHVSWIDIPVLAYLTGASFVAKAEVGNWPVIGILARRYGCVFVERRQALGALRQADDLAVALRQSRGLVLFPEGTTSDGSSVLPFRTSLFAAVPAADGPAVQPVAICLRDRRVRAEDGDRALAPWLGEDALLPHALRVAAHGGVVAEIWFEPVVESEGRKATAYACRRAILARVAGDDQAAPLNLAA